MRTSTEYFFISVSAALLKSGFVKRSTPSRKSMESDSAERSSRTPYSSLPNAGMAVGPM